MSSDDDINREIESALILLRDAIEAPSRLGKKDLRPLLDAALSAEANGLRYLATGEPWEAVAARDAIKTAWFGLREHRKRDQAGAPKWTEILSGDDWVLKQLEVDQSSSIPDLVRQAVKEGRLDPDIKDTVHCKRIRRWRERLGQ